MSNWPINELVIDAKWMWCQECRKWAWLSMTHDHDPWSLSSVLCFSSTRLRAVLCCFSALDKSCLSSSTWCCGLKTRSQTSLCCSSTLCAVTMVAAETCLMWYCWRMGNGLDFVAMAISFQARHKNQLLIKVKHWTVFGSLCTANWTGTLLWSLPLNNHTRV